MDIYICQGCGEVVGYTGCFWRLWNLRLRDERGRFVRKPTYWSHRYGRLRRNSDYSLIENAHRIEHVNVCEKMTCGVVKAHPIADSGSDKAVIMRARAERRLRGIRTLS